MKAGFARRTINPPLGMEMEGLGQKGGCQTIHDDIFVYALYVEHEGSPALILSYDLLFFERGQADRLKGAIGRKLDLPFSRILLNTSHSHAGPRITRWFYSPGVDPLYMDRVEAATVEAAAQAAAEARAVTMHAGVAPTAVPVNRRKPDPQGRILWAPYRAGEICEPIPFCVFTDAAGGVVSVMFCVSCHPSMVHSLDISAEYPGAAVRRLNAYFKTTGAMFLQGAGGDAKPRQIAQGEERWRAGTWEEVEEAGREVAETVIAAVQRGLAPVTPDIRTHVAEMQWALQPLPDRAALEKAAADDTVRHKQRMSWGREMLERLDRYGGLPTHVSIGLHGLQIGRGVRLIGLEGELVADLGNLILREYDRGITFPLGYVDGCQLYLPSDRLIDEGGYEVHSFWEYHWPAPLAKGVDASLRRALQTMKESGRIPNDPL